MNSRSTLAYLAAILLGGAFGLMIGMAMFAGRGRGDFDAGGATLGALGGALAGALAGLLLARGFFKPWPP